MDLSLQLIMNLAHDVIFPNDSFIPTEHNVVNGVNEPLS